MGTYDLADLVELIVKTVEAETLKQGVALDSVGPDINIMDVFDSFGVLEVILTIEEDTGLSADLALIDFEKTVTITGLAEEIIRINSGA